MGPQEPCAERAASQDGETASARADPSLRLHGRVGTARLGSAGLWLFSSGIAHHSSTGCLTPPACVSEWVTAWARGAQRGLGGLPADACMRAGEGPMAGHEAEVPPPESGDSSRYGNVISEPDVCRNADLSSLGLGRTWFPGQKLPERSPVFHTQVRLPRFWGTPGMRTWARCGHSGVTLGGLHPRPQPSSGRSVSLPCHSGQPD